MILAASVLLGLSPASAEWYVGGYAGVAIPDDEDIDSRSTVVGSHMGVTATGIRIIAAKDLDLETSTVFGGKIGYFFEELPYLGVELEGYHFSPAPAPQIVEFAGTDQLFVDGTDLGIVRLTEPPVVPEEGGPDIDVTAIGINAIYRLQLAKDDTVPKGRFQPYIGVGLGIFIANVETQLNILPVRGDDTDTELGVQALAGLKYLFTKNLSLFAEYKFIQTGDFEFELSGSGELLSPFPMPTPFREKERVVFDLTSHLIYGGVVWYF